MEIDKDAKDIIVMDLKMVPQGWDAAKVLHLMKTTGIMVIDSTRGGVKPFTLHDAKELKFEEFDKDKDYGEGRP